MTEKLNIVQSTTEPDKRNIWLKDNELKKFGVKGWSTIGGSNTGGGGGTSTDKDALDIYIDSDTNSIIVNDKTYAASFQNSDIGLLIMSSSKELYNMLCNSLINTYKTVYIKSIPTSQIYVFCEPSIKITPSEGIIMLGAYIAEGVLSINILNE